MYYSENITYLSTDHDNLIHQICSSITPLGTNITVDNRLSVKVYEIEINPKRNYEVVAPVLESSFSKSVGRLLLGIILRKWTSE